MGLKGSGLTQKSGRQAKIRNKK